MVAAKVVSKFGPVALGKLCRDRISGFEGVAVCESRWLNGCVRWTLQPKALNKDKAPTTGTVKP